MADETGVLSKWRQRRGGCRGRDEETGKTGGEGDRGQKVSGEVQKNREIGERNTEEEAKRLAALEQKLQSSVGSRAQERKTYLESVLKGLQVKAEVDDV
jgi:hypothetical protein